MLKKTATAILEDGVKLTVEGARKHRWMGWRKVKVQREFVIRPLTLGSLIRISRIILGIEDDVFKKESVLEAIYIAADKYAGQMAEVVAIAVTNTKAPPPETLISFIKSSVTVMELQHIYRLIIDRMDVRDFYEYYKLNQKHQSDEDDDDEKSEEVNILWRTIGGWIKYFRLSWDQILWEISYQNLLMLSGTIPTYKKKGKSGELVTEKVREVESAQELANFLGIKK